MNFRCETDMLNKSKRLLCGTLILILVDVIWVSCSELNKVSFVLLSDNRFDFTL